MATSSRSYPNNLPVALSSFVGREREIAEVKQWLSAHRLVTLIGPGGCGKTRLSIWVAGELGEEFKDGVWLAELAPLANPELVPQTVATEDAAAHGTGH
jgi:MoxR-like ATPase